MLNISTYLKKFKHLTSSEGEVKKVVIEAVFKQCNITLTNKEVKFQNKKVFIDAHPIVKNEINLKRKEILTRIHEQCSYPVKDIR